MLKLSLDEIKSLGVDNVWVTAADWNIGSQKTILANGGLFEDNRFDPNTGDMIYRY